MTARRPPRTRLALGATLLAVAALAPACGPPAEDAGTARRYRVRGVVRQASDGPAVPLLVTHEAIPDLVDAAGAPAPMAAMTMPFAAAPEVDLSTLAPGDVVELILELDWTAASALRIVAFERLPPETILDLDPDDGH